jgi:hypothetical protein
VNKCAEVGYIMCCVRWHGCVEKKLRVVELCLSEVSTRIKNVCQILYEGRVCG